MFKKKEAELEKKSAKLKELAKNADRLVNSKMSEVEGGCWTCDSYCKKKV